MSEQWISDVRDDLGVEYAEVARAMLDGSLKDKEAAETAMHKMSEVGLLDDEFVISDEGKTWTLRYSLPEQYC